jgi:3-methylcrotonyl-CoA carboxylase beta subunit
VRARAEAHRDHRASYGAGNYGMCGRAYGPRFLWTWPNARIGVMGGRRSRRRAEPRARPVGDEGAEQAEAATLRAEMQAQYERQSTAVYGARLWDDGIIDPVDTRAVLGASLAAASNAPLAAETPFGIFRM